jgi:hypothetical protein
MDRGQYNFHNLVWKGARDASVGQLVKQMWVWLAERGVNMVELRWVKSEDMKMDALSR